MGLFTSSKSTSTSTTQDFEAAGNQSGVGNTTLAGSGQSLSQSIATDVASVGNTGSIVSGSTLASRSISTGDKSYMDVESGGAPVAIGGDIYISSPVSDAKTPGLNGTDTTKIDGGLVSDALKQTSGVASSSFLVPALAIAASIVVAWFYFRK